MVEKPEYYYYKLLDFRGLDEEGRCVKEDAFNITDREIPIFWCLRDLDSYNPDNNTIGYATLYKQGGCLCAKCWFFGGDRFHTDVKNLVCGMYIVSENTVIQGPVIQSGEITALLPIIFDKFPANHGLYFE